MTASVERLEERVADALARLDLIEDMVDTTRRVVAAEKFKVETDTDSPHIIETSDGGSLELGYDSPMRIVDKLNVEVSHTGDTNETTLHTTTLEADSMGPKGFLRIFASFRGTGAGTHYFKTYFGGNQVTTWPGTGTLYMLDMTTVYVWNREATNSQGAGIADCARHVKNSESPYSTAVDTTQDVDIDFTVQNTAAAATAFLRFLLVEAHYSD